MLLLNLSSCAVGMLGGGPRAEGLWLSAIISLLCIIVSLFSGSTGVKAATISTGALPVLFIGLLIVSKSSEHLPNTLIAAAADDNDLARVQANLQNPSESRYVNTTNSQGMSPLDYAARNRNPTMARLLQAQGARATGWTLVQAIRSNDPAMVQTIADMRPTFESNAALDPIIDAARHRRLYRDQSSEQLDRNARIIAILSHAFGPHPSCKDVDAADPQLQKERALHALACNAMTTNGQAN
ncbi:ankyrin repeat domain-containing protein [Lysobacter sp. HA35]